MRGEFCGLHAVRRPTGETINHHAWRYDIVRDGYGKLYRDGRHLLDIRKEPAGWRIHSIGDNGKASSRTWPTQEEACYGRFGMAAMRAAKNAQAAEPSQPAPVVPAF